MLENIDLFGIHEENARQLIAELLNLIEKLSADLRDLQIENQRLRDEINRLKGEQGQPNILPNTSPVVTKHSSEKERHRHKRHQKSSKKADLKISREKVIEVDPSLLPADAQFKGYEEVIVQDLCLGTDNICFRKQKFYSASERKTYLAKLPCGYEGQYGPGVKSLVLTLYNSGHMSEPKILEFLKNVGVQISDGELSNLLIKKQDVFHAEKDAVCEAGLRSSPYQHTDDTQTRVNGQNQHCHVVCNPVYSAYHTRPTKERLAVLDVLRNMRERTFRLNREALGYLDDGNLSQATRQRLQSWVSEEDMNEATFIMRLEEALPKLSPPHRKIILDAAAIAAYHAETDFPVIDVLLCDDAPQFKGLTRSLMLCWIHEGRPYKKLLPVVSYHREILNGFLKRFWNYYDQLLTYRQSPNAAEHQRLSAEFDHLFSTQTGYAELDKRIAKTLSKKTNLLLVLKYPELLLHNNSAELAARQRVRKRDVSFGPRTSEGVRAWDTFMTLTETTKKLGVNFYEYIQDRIRQTHQIPSLASLVQKAAQELKLGQSWAVA